MTAPMTPNLDQERVERAARAIYEGRNGKGCKPWSLQAKAHKEPYLHDARAAITAYLDDTHAVVPREPTEAMLMAGEDTFVSGYTGTPTSSPEDVWKAMLSAAHPGKEG